MIKSWNIWFAKKLPRNIDNFKDIKEGETYAAEFVKNQILLGSRIHSNVRQLPVDQLNVVTKRPEFADMLQQSDKRKKGKRNPLREADR